MQRRLAMLESRECGAKTRKGARCRSPAMPNGRCRMHGGKSTGAPKGMDAIAKSRKLSVLLSSSSSRMVESFCLSAKPDVRDLSIEGLWLGLSLGLAGATSATLRLSSSSSACSGVQSASGSVISRPRLSPLELIWHLSMVQSPRLIDFQRGVMFADLMERERAHPTQKATPIPGRAAMILALAEQIAKR